MGSPRRMPRVATVSVDERLSRSVAKHFREEHGSVNSPRLEVIGCHDVTAVVFRRTFPLNIHRAGSQVLE